MSLYTPLNSECVYQRPFRSHYAQHKQKSLFQHRRLLSKSRMRLSASVVNGLKWFMMLWLHQVPHGTRKKCFTFLVRSNCQQYQGNIEMLHSFPKEQDILSHHQPWAGLQGDKALPVFAACSALFLGGGCRKVVYDVTAVWLLDMVK